MLRFDEAVDQLKKNKENGDEKEISTMMLKSMRNGELKFEIGNGKSIDDFYSWCKNYVDKNKDGTHPLNWLNIALYSQINEHMKELPGVAKMIKAAKSQLVDKAYEFVIMPSLLLPNELEEFIQDKSLYYLSKGTLINDKKNNYFCMKTKNGKVLLKFCWIIKEVTQ